RGPGQARPCDLGVVIGLERAMPLFPAAGGGFLEFGVGIGSADHPVPGIARFLFDPESRTGVIDRAPCATLPLGLRLFVGLERTGSMLRTAVLHAVEFGVGIDSADNPVAFHDQSRCKSMVNPTTY